MILELENIFNKKNTTIKQSSSDLFISSDDTFLSSVKEMYIIEGYPVPYFISTFDSDGFSKYLTAKQISRIILDIRKVEPSFQVETVSKVLALIDMGIVLITLGNQDSIRLQKLINSQGAIYVLWDESLLELNSIIQNGNITNNYNGVSRVAKRVLILGSKGGVGVSCFSSMVASAIANYANLHTLLVDHDANAINSDVYVGIRNLKMKSSASELVNAEIDKAVAKSYIHKVSDKLSYLTLSRRDLTKTQEHSGLLYSISKELAGEYNYIFDSVPVSELEAINLSKFHNKYHRIFIVCEPSVSSLRAFNTIKREALDKKIDVVFNLTRPKSDYLMTVSDAKNRIKEISVIDIEYETGLDKYILQNGVKGLVKRKYFLPIAEIVRSLTGKNIYKRKPTIASIFKK
ncbi:MAG: AAA family ATPase [Turicibacter sp.]